MTIQFDPLKLFALVHPEAVQEAVQFRQQFPVPKVGPEYGTVLFFPEAMALGHLAAEHAIRALEGRGQVVGEDHRKALQAACELLARLAAGDKTGRYVIDLPTGAGKSLALVSFVKTLIAHGPPDWSVAIAAQRVEELGDLHDGLIGDESPVAPEDIGLWHRKSGFRLPSTYRPEEIERYQECRVLLMTHARLQQGDGVTLDMRYQGRPRNLVVHDESFRSAEARLVPYLDLTGALERICRRDGLADGEKEAVQRIKTQIDEEVAAQRRGAAPRELRFEGFNHDLVDRLAEIARKSGTGADAKRTEALDLLRRVHLPARVLRLGEGEAREFLVQTLPLVSENLERIVALDASFSVRHLISTAAEVRRKTAPHLGLNPIRSLWQYDPTAFKHYDRVTIHYARTRNSGRDFALEDLGKGKDSVLAKELVYLLTAGVPKDKAVLVVTMKADDQRGVNPEAVLTEALQAVGVEPSAMVKTTNGTEVAKVDFLTYGRETASNAYADYEVVVFLGCLEQREEELVGRYLAESGDLLAEVSSEEVKRLRLGEVQHSLLQAMSRVAMRQVFVDEAGKTQAKRTEVYLALRHSEEDLQDLKGALQGAEWRKWEPRHWKQEEPKIDRIGDLLIAALENLDPAVTKISTIQLKRCFDELRVGSGDTFTAAVEKVLPVLKTHGWEKRERSFHRTMVDAAQ